MIHTHAFSETDYRWFVSKKSIRTHDNWKCIFDYSTGETELYNLLDDPGERNNLAKTRRDKANELKEIIVEYLDRHLSDNTSVTTLGESTSHTELTNDQNIWGYELEEMYAYGEIGLHPLKWTGS